MSSGERILTVSEITRSIKRVLEEGFADVSVQGEISNFKQHSSGHLYFTLKDEGAQLQAVMWRGRAMSLFFTPQDGMKVVTRGSITVYEVRGVYQISVVDLRPLGVGELQLAFEKLKQKLADEGLFDEAHKKPIPEFPERIGLVTSPTGAAIRDILTVISRRFPAIELILAPVRVQGAEAAQEIAGAIQDFNDYGNVDVLIVGRGGGSLEDLWAFNEEVVARAIYASEIPIISAVGHEIDFTIADFVADLRAPTPSAAAEMAVRDQVELVEIVRNFSYTSREHLADLIQSLRDTVRNLLGSYAFHTPIDRVRQYSQRVDELGRGLPVRMSHYLTFLHKHIDSLERRLHTLSPDAVLKRGYSLVSHKGELVARAGELDSGDEIAVRFHDGSVPATVD
jgi:exodeoxyribonuclease VII large subunit